MKAFKNFPYLKSFSFILIFLIQPFLSYGKSTVSINDAIDHKIIDYHLTGSWSTFDRKEFIDADGKYFGKCMLLEVHSRIDSAIFLFLDDGILLMSDDTAVQDMIITKPFYVDLRPNQTKKVQFYAMCTEIHDGIPHNMINYSIAKRGDSNLVSITRSIDEMFMNNIAGQGAVWCYTDRAGEDDLRRYGATDISIQLTIDILNRAGVVTKLNPPVTKSPDTMQIVSDFPPPKTVSTDDDFLYVNKYLIFGLSGVSILFLGSTIILLFRRKKRNEN